MAKSSTGFKLIAILVVATIGAAMGFGYFKQSAVLEDSQAKTTAKISGTTLNPRPADIIVGDVNALVTIVEYMSLSCNHCADFNQKVLPELEKEYITPGQVKLVVRHFPLNEPALKAAMLTECAGQNGLERKSFVKVLFDMQEKWAFTQDYLKNLKQIALVGGIDSASFESCMTDKDLEAEILTSRKEGEEQLKITGTPAFFINGAPYEGERTAAGFRTAIEAAKKAQQ